MPTRNSQAELKSRIRALFDQHEGRYGYRRITLALRQDGCCINHKAVQRHMRDMALRAKTRPKRYRAWRGSPGRVAPNLIKRCFQADGPNRKWVTDITEFKLGAEKLYLSPIMDLYNGEIVAYELSRRPDMRMIDAMLQRAFSCLQADDKPVLHSDQGLLYQMEHYQQQLANRCVTPSMSRKANCLDNAAMESFFATLKSELFYLKRFANMDHLQTEITDYIHYYNHDRIKAKLGGLSPVQYRMRAVKI